MHEATIIHTTLAGGGALTPETLAAYAVKRAKVNLDAALGCLMRLTCDMEAAGGGVSVPVDGDVIADWAAQLRWIGDRMGEELRQVWTKS